MPWKLKGTGREDPLEEAPKRRSARRERPVSRMDQDDVFFYRHLAAVSRHADPLLRWLRRQVGRPWTQVEAEIAERCQSLKADAAIRTAVRKWVVRYVDTSPSVPRRPGLLHGAGTKRYFVHAEKGTLCLRQQSPKPRPRG